MRARFLSVMALFSAIPLACAVTALAAPRQHTIVLGRWRTVEIDSANAAKIRELIVDGRLREYTTGPLHEITDRLFVIRRVQRLNDSLPDDAGKKERWVWRLENWISVDRQTGHIAQLNMPAFDSELSQVIWYRDYAAYCGSPEDNGKLYAVVFQLGKRKPLLKKEIAAGSVQNCAALKWERGPARVTFNAGGEKSSFVVRAHSAEAQPESNTEEGPQ